MTTAIRAETFNPATLFLLGTPAVGAERLVLDVAHAQRAPLYVNKSKLKVREKTMNSSSEGSRQTVELGARMDWERIPFYCTRAPDIVMGVYTLESLSRPSADAFVAAAAEPRRGSNDRRMHAELTQRKRALLRGRTRQVMSCLLLSAADRAVITTDADKAQLQAVPTTTVTVQSMTRILKYYANRARRYNTIVGFVPPAAGV